MNSAGRTEEAAISAICLAKLTASHTALTDSHKSILSTHTAAATEVLTLQAAAMVSESRHSALSATYAALKDSHEEIRIERRQLGESITVLEFQLGNLTSQHAVLDGDYQRAAAAGVVAEGEIESMKVR